MRGLGSPFLFQRTEAIWRLGIASCRRNILTALRSTTNILGARKLIKAAGPAKLQRWLAAAAQYEKWNEQESRPPGKEAEKQRSDDLRARAERDTKEVQQQVDALRNLLNESLAMPHAIRPE